MFPHFEIYVYWKRKVTSSWIWSSDPSMQPSWESLWTRMACFLPRYRRTGLCFKYLSFNFGTFFNLDTLCAVGTHSLSPICESIVKRSQAQVCLEHLLLQRWGFLISLLDFSNLVMFDVSALRDVLIFFWKRKITSRLIWTSNPSMQPSWDSLWTRLVCCLPCYRGTS